MAAQVPVPTATVGNKNYFTGQTINYSGSPYTPLYDQTGTLQGFSNNAGAFVDPNSALAGLVAPKIDVSGAAGGGAAAGPASYLNPTPGNTNMPAIMPGSGATHMYYSTPSTGPGAAAYDPNTYSMAAGAQNLFGGTPYMGYQIYQAPGGMVAAYDPNTGTFGRLQGNSYVPMSRDEATQAGLISATTTPALPEQNALGMMGQIDPTGEALRQSLGQSYLSTLGQAPMPTAPTMAQGPSFAGGQAPAAGDVQSYLNLYKQIDPQGYAQRQGMAQQVGDYVTRVTGQAPSSAQDALAKYSQLDPAGYAQLGQLGGAMGSYLSSAQQQAALGTQLDPETVREITQATRQGQVARGNVYGTPQLMQEAITRGQAGLAIQQQRQAALGQATQGMQSYLGSGLTPGEFGQNLYQQGLAQQQAALGTQQGWLSSGQSLGDIANNLYQQGFARNLGAYQAQQQAAIAQNQQALNLYQSQLGARSGAQQGALGYLGSGQTPLGAATSYMGMGEQAAGAAAQGGTQYNPASLSPTYTGAGASQFPQYGIDTSQLANQWYNSLGAYGGGMPTSGGNLGKAAGSAATGALSGAASGAALGSAVPGIGTAVGAVGGALVGGLGAGASSYYS
jgi:hypothetical protein